jgi:hypothetical protein
MKFKLKTIGAISKKKKWWAHRPDVELARMIGGRADGNDAWVRNPPVWAFSCAEGPSGCGLG